MNSYYKFCPNVFVARCPEKHEKGDVIEITTKYGKVNEHIIHNLVREKDGFFYYSITRADGFNMQERARRKAEKYGEWAGAAQRKSAEYFEKSQKDRDFLVLGEPVKVGHHSESRHRKAIDDAWNNTGKMVEFADKADQHMHKSEYWEKRAEAINLSMPESIEYYRKKYESAKEYHKGLKSGKYQKAHSMSMQYANRAVKEAEKNYNLAKLLWE